MPPSDASTGSAAKLGGADQVCRPSPIGKCVNEWRLLSDRVWLSVCRATRTLGVAAPSAESRPLTARGITRGERPLMKSLPAGTVTFLFTGIERGTGPLQHLGDAYLYLEAPA